MIPEKCSKCNGRVTIERDWYGTYGTCIQCSKQYYITEVVDINKEPTRRKRVSLPVAKKVVA